MAKEKSFEEQLLELEEIVAKLENGNTPLDEAVTLFEKGMKLSASCHQRIDKAEQKVKKLTENEDGTLTETEFESGEEE